MQHPNSGMNIKRAIASVMISALFCVASSAGLTVSSYAQTKKTDTAKQEKAADASKKVKSIEEERLNIVKADIQKAIAEYKKLKAEADKSIKAADEKSQEKMINVAKMFESMPAEEAARRMEKLDDNSALMILKTLKPKSAGKILAQMEIERAAALSKKMIPGTIVPQEKTSQ
ncbi:MAG: hypothetical protein LLF86_06615 [Nitrospiraceae bacterium]|nr:hypothetical protein [Nitrospiraceae bacterium]